VTDRYNALAWEFLPGASPEYCGRLAALLRRVADEERERCAKVADEWAEAWSIRQVESAEGGDAPQSEAHAKRRDASDVIAAAIRGGKRDPD
jgi:hypothetical protein